MLNRRKCELLKCNHSSKGKKVLILQESHVRTKDFCLAKLHLAYLLDEEENLFQTKYVHAIDTSRAATSGFHRGSPRLHHRGPSGVNDHVSWFTHGRAPHVHWRPSHIRRGATRHLGHVYRWGLVWRWSSHVTPAKYTQTQMRAIK